MRGAAEGDSMMSTVISSKKVMDVLLEEYNKNSEAYYYYRLTKDNTSASVCMASMTTVCEILDSLGFEDGADYETKSVGLFRSGIHFMTVRKERIA